ncbi:MAG: type II restriction endonuclease [Candidatus Velthaea sp.]
MPPSEAEGSEFETLLTSYLSQIQKQVVSESGDWTVKGFIDVYKRIYTISLDTKVLSKVLELLMFPVLCDFAETHGYKMELARQQNQYPDLSFISPHGEKIALDIKSTYRTKTDRDGHKRVSGMTLGTFMGYFRNRSSASISTFPYEQYAHHYVLGVVYTQVKGVDERKSYSIEDLADIPSVAKDFEFFLQEKYRIAADYAGSGNTKNIGSTRFLDRMLNGAGVFAKLGVDVFDDYWMNYRTKEMARAEGLSAQPYKNLIEYQQHKRHGQEILAVPEAEIESEAIELGEEPADDGVATDEDP